MNRGSTGEYVVVSRSGGEVVRAFVPRPLPPHPSLAPGSSLLESLDRAHLALGRLDAVTTLLPDTHLFLYTYIRKEAVLSSQIEGTQSSLSDLLLFELDEVPGVPLDDVSEVSCYVAALEHGLKRLRGGFPLSNRLLREMHEVLLAKGRGAEKERGAFRRSQNWIGGTRPGNALYVPPPPGHVPDAMAALERFLHDRPARTSPLVKAALAHVQFETIHPFLDGNGRLGRLLITLVLVAEGVLQQPLLYLSLYLKKHRKTYYDLLTMVRQDGDWERWLAFFAEAVELTAMGAVDTARTLGKLFAEDRARIVSLGRGADSALRLHAELQRRPVATAPALSRVTKLTPPTVGKALRELVGLGIARETTGRKRGRVFVHDRYLSLLNKGTEIA
jgi:Fic family protein